MKHHLLLPGPFGVASRSLCGALTTIFSSFTQPDGSQMPHSSSGHSLFHRPSLPREVSHQVATSMPHFSSRALLKPLCVFSFLNSFLPSRFLGATHSRRSLWRLEPTLQKNMSTHKQVEAKLPERRRARHKHNDSPGERQKSKIFIEEKLPHQHLASSPSPRSLLSPRTVYCGVWCAAPASQLLRQAGKPSQHHHPTAVDV